MSFQYNRSSCCNGNPDAENVRENKISATAQKSNAYCHDRITFMSTCTYGIHMYPALSTCIYVLRI